MFCQKCGKPTEGDRIICAECAAQEPAVEETLPKEDTAPQAEAAPQEEATPQEEPAFTVNFPQDPVPEAPKAKKKGGLIAAIAAVAVVAVLAVAALLNLDALINFWHSTFSSPAEHLVYVEEKALFAALDDLADIYGTFRRQEKGPASASASLHVGEKAQAMLETSLAAEGMELDMSFLSDLKLNVNGNVDGDNTQQTLTLTLGDTTVLTMDAIITPTQSFLAFPELNSDYLATDVESALPAFSPEDLPEAATLSTLPREYITLILEGIADVTREKTTLSLAGVDQKVTALTATVTEAETMAIATSLVEKLAKDQTAKDFLLSFSGAYDLTNGSASEDAAELDKALEELLTSLRENAPTEGNYLTFTAYVDGKGNVVGNEFTRYYADPEMEAETVRYISVTDKKTTHFSLSTDAGTMLDGTYADGTRTVHFYAGEELAFTVTVSDWYHKDDVMKGTFLFTPAVEEDPESLYTLLGGDPSIQITFDISKAAASTAVTFLAGSEEVASCTVSGAPGESAPIQVPEIYISTEDQDAMYLYMEDLKIDQVTANLEKGGMPAELSELVEYMFYSMVYGY